ncbi:carbon catabolite repressor protein 4 homolog 6-like [Papaver somniferum]|uniref:carbon catabolite repressor protein 4 homolog 6-like n=1 Tax=Papaver somniferum TaxID=3469 RepID=UPI000E6F791A|nr:carbon catabolite repressor protein 4 homolog 6-like [Papaver somniferum]
MRFASSSSSSLQSFIIAAATTDINFASMSSLRGGYPRGGAPCGEFCSPSENQESLVTEDSHFPSVEARNNGFRQHNGRNFQNQHYRQPPPQQQPFPHPSPQYRHQQPTPPPYYRQQQPNPPLHYRQQRRIPPPYYGQQQMNRPHHYRQQQPIPPPHYGQQQPNRPLHYRQQRPFTPPGTKQWDYRKWELAVSQPPPQCERFVVLSYNILANYLALDHRRELYFHIPFYVLDWERRKRNILFELGLWSADIMCLQEVDRFQDLENELKVHGYEGIWKMRTGQAIDGCAIFWRTTRFKLRHEESIEFRNLGLRDNVAQVCVLESRNQNSSDKVSADSPTSASDANLVVICNIHVLFNPKRGEIKLGQVRVLLERAHAVSKLWRDAPLVLCGDFNCTPKSPLYNLILDQKLNLDGLARNQVSGQPTAEISELKRNYPNSGNGFPRAQSNDGTVSTSMLVEENVDMKHGNELPNMHDKNKPCDEVDNSFLATNLAKPQNICEMVNAPMESGSDVQYKNENSRTYDVIRIEEEILDNCKDQFMSPHSVSLEQIKESPNGIPEEGVPPVDLENDGVEELSSLIPSYNDDDVCMEIVSENVERPGRTLRTQPSLSSSNPVIETTKQKSVCSDMEKRNLESVERINPSTLSEGTYHVKISAASTSIDLSVDPKSGTMLVNKSGEDREEVDQEHGTTSEICHTDATMLDAVCDSKFLSHESAETDQSSEKLSDTAHISDLPPPCSDVQIDFSTSISSEPATTRRYTYDPSSWTPMDIETATGNAECMLLESPLKLKSSYAEVEDFSGTRDPVSMEPQVTSYHRRFAGTVDYIWHSEDLQTVKVLDTIPKQALQNWSLGFPTKKWGSDHLALASQLAFKKDT